MGCGASGVLDNMLRRSLHAALLDLGEQRAAGWPKRRTEPLATLPGGVPVAQPSGKRALTQIARRPNPSDLGCHGPRRGVLRLSASWLLLSGAIRDERAIDARGPGATGAR